jgi:hypothetical protein
LTHAITALVLGEENKANPNPVTQSAVIMAHSGVSKETEEKKARQRAHIPIPVLASLYGCVLSDHLPAIGEKKACIRGCVTSMSPAAWESYPITT